MFPLFWKNYTKNFNKGIYTLNKALEIVVNYSKLAKGKEIKKFNIFFITMMRNVHKAKFLTPRSVLSLMFVCLFVCN